MQPWPSPCYYGVHPLVAEYAAYPHPELGVRLSESGVRLSESGVRPPESDFCRPELSVSMPTR